MPLYEYQCRKCSHVFEKIQAFSDPPVKKCPKCGGAVEKLLSAPAVQFKGSGWYVTDYARSGKASKKPESGGDGTAPEAAREGADKESVEKSATEKPESKKPEKSAGGGAKKAKH